MPEYGSDEDEANTGRGTLHRLGERRDRSSRDALLDRVAAEFREMPCLRLTLEEAERLFGVPGDVSRRIMDTLITEGRLRMDDDGRYAAAD